MPTRKEDAWNWEVEIQINLVANEDGETIGIEELWGSLTPKAWDKSVKEYWEYIEQAYATLRRAISKKRREMEVSDG